MNCPTCQSQTVAKNGTTGRQDGSVVQKYVCKACRKQFNDRTGTPMSRLRTSSVIVAAALNVRSEGMGIRATGRVFGKSHSTVMRWEQRLARQCAGWSPPAPVGADVTLEGDEVYTRVGENLPPAVSQGWTIHFIERESRYWVAAQAGKKETQLFEQGTRTAWNWAKQAQFIRWFTDGERRYSKALWKLASIYLKQGEAHSHYPYRQVWREGLEVAMKIKGSQGQRRVAWVKPTYPFTAISATCEVHANHNEAQNSALRRHCSAYRRRQNLYAKCVPGLQRVLEVQRLVHNWVRPHWGLAKGTTPAMAMGLCDHPVSMHELLTKRGFASILR